MAPARRQVRVNGDGEGIAPWVSLRSAIGHRAEVMCLKGSGLIRNCCKPLCSSDLSLAPDNVFLIHPPPEKKAGVVPSSGFSSI